MMPLLAVRALLLAVLLAALGGVSSPLVAQSDAACPALVELALSQMGNNCARLERNVACYGYNRVEASFSGSVPDGFFTRPSDRAPLAALQTIRAAPLDLGLRQWGIAVLNVQANVPDTLPGQAVIFLLVGDTEVENAVSAPAASEPVTVTLAVEAALHTGPDAATPTLVAIPAGTQLAVQARSADSQWLRIAAGTDPVWLPSAAIVANPAVARLPVAQPTGSPMQAFYFRTGPAATQCLETPSVLAIRSPENITVDLNVNGADIRLGSLITLRTIGDLLRLTTLYGQAIIGPNGSNPILVPAGFTTSTCLADPTDLGADGQANDRAVDEDCAWEPPRLATPDELRDQQLIQRMLAQLGLESGPPPTPAAPECPFGTTITHVVSRGENLFRISLRYQTSVAAILQANGLTNPSLIYPNQRLTIPCGVDTGRSSFPPSLPPLPPPVLVPGFPSPPASVDCSRFRATSPLDGLPVGQATFFWDPAPGAAAYRVNIYNLDERGGALVGTFVTSGTNTNLTAPVTIDALGYGFSFAWEVLAIGPDGQVACASTRYRVPRAPQPGPSGPLSP